MTLLKDEEACLIAIENAVDLQRQYVFYTNEQIAALETTLEVVIKERDELRKKLESHYMEEVPAFLALAREHLTIEWESVSCSKNLCAAIESILDFLEKK